MSEVKHTPGPWVSEYRQSHTGQVAVCNGDGEGYWEVWTQNWGGGINQEANARLISAAPDLLEALEEIVSHDAWASDAPILASAKAAIAKAKGEQA
jgi:hypothetical protein